MKPLNKYIDHTNLKPDATEADIIRLCDEAKKNDFASVCINPINVRLAKKELEGSDVKVCTVIGFPLGQNRTETKVFETELALKDGCDDISAVVKAASGKTVKVIIESGLLEDEEIARATRLSCEAGADFVKTCTGFGTGVATVHAVSVMKENLTGDVKIKASAGIKTYEDAKALIEAGAHRLGTSSGAAIIEGALK